MLNGRIFLCKISIRLLSLQKETEDNTKEQKEEEEDKDEKNKNVKKDKSINTILTN